MKGKCFECEEVGDIDNHHVVPKSLGGSKTVPLCLKCHGLVHDRNFVKHRRLLRLGVERAKKEGKFAGRRKGTSIPLYKFLGTKRNKEIIDCLNIGLSIRKTAKEVGCSPGLVQKVSKVYNIKFNETQLKMPIAIIFDEFSELFQLRM